MGIPPVFGQIGLQSGLSSAARADNWGNLPQFEHNLKKISWLMGRFSETIGFCFVNKSL
jgi:hypothetical protein